MARLNIDRQKKLEPIRMETALKALKSLNNACVISHDTSKIQFMHECELCTYYPYSGWATGKTIKDGRGLKRLLKQLKAKSNG